MNAVLNITQNTNKDSEVLDRELDELSKTQELKNTRSAEKAHKLAEINAQMKLLKDAVKADYANDGIIKEDERITSLLAEIEERKIKLQNKVNEYKFTGKLVNAVSFFE